MNSVSASSRSARVAAIALLRQRDFTLLFTGQAISKLGNSAYQVGLGWSVYQVTNSSAAMGLVLAVNVTPQILLTVFGGVLGDRLPRKAVVIGSDAVSALITAIVAAAAAVGELTYWLLILVSLVLGIASAFYSPAYRGILPDVVDASQLQRANGLLSASLSLGRVLGPTAAGLAYAWQGPELVFAFDSATFLVSVVTMMFVRSPSAPAALARSLGSDMRDGLAFLLKTRWLVWVITLSLAANTLTLAPFFVLAPLIVRLSGGGPQLLGAAMAVQAGGAVVGALLIGRIPEPRSPGVLLANLAALMAVGGAIVALSTHLSYLMLVGALCIGLGFSFDVVENALIQSRVPRQYLSRIYSLNLLGSYALFPLGYLLAGLLARLLWPPELLYACSALMVLVCAATARSRSLTATGARIELLDT